MSSQSLHKLAEIESANHSPDDLAQLAKEMVSNQVSVHIPAGYTYLGQFIDHDISFFFDDPDTVQDAPVAIEGIRNQASPWLDLDSVYGSEHRVSEGGSHPEIEESKFVLWPSGSICGDDEKVGRDLPREESSKRALIPDPRNDENLLVAQFHVAVMKFHNRMIKELKKEDIPEGDCQFDAARRETIGAFQHIVLKDYLYKVCNLDVVNLLEQHGDLIHDILGKPGISREFAGAAFRFAHVMVQPSYRLRVNADPVNLDKLMKLTGNGGLDGQRRLPSKFLPAWQHFFQSWLYSEGVQVQQARKLVPFIAEPLSDIRVAGGSGKNLAELDLLRGRWLGLPSGQRLAETLGKELSEKFATADLDPGISFEPLREEDIVKASCRNDLIKEKGFDQDTPLWYYLLCEAKARGGERLGALGSLIVAYTLHKASGRWDGTRFEPVWKPESSAPIRKHIEDRNEERRIRSREKSTSSNGEISIDQPDFGAIDFIEYALGFEH